jgi:hypothetical protein
LKGKTIKGIVPKPNEINKKLLELAGVKMPPIIPSKGINVVSKKSWSGKCNLLICHILCYAKM